MIIKEKTRDEIDKKYKWDLTCIYKNNKEFEEDLANLKELIDKIDSFKGKITLSSKALYDYLCFEDKLSSTISNLFLYVNCLKDQDVVDNKNTKRYNEILNLVNIASEKLSFTTPEMLKTDYSVIKKYIEEDERLKEYAFDLKEIYKYQDHILDSEKEVLLSYIGNLQESYETSSEALTDGIIKYGTITDEEGNTVELSSGNLAKYLKSKDRNVRKEAFTKRVMSIKEYENVLAINYENHLKADSYIAKERKYNSTLEMYLFSDDVSIDIYNNLLKFAKKNLKTLHKYFKLKKDYLKLDTMYDYDVKAPLLDESKIKFSYEEATDIIKKALRVYGDSYSKVLEEIFNKRLIDVYPNKGKRSGFYSTESASGIPFILANFNNDYYGMSALAHELGHSVHSYFSSMNNPYHLSSYSLFVAEVASLTNEILLANYIINNSDSKELKKIAIYNMLDFIVDNLFGTIASGSIFEKEVHEKADNKEAIGVLGFLEINEKIMKDYYGKIVNRSIANNANSLAVPHFYTSFYYYKYSIGIIGACYVANKLLNNDQEYLSKYLNFLKLGGCMSPIEELKTIDIDFTNEEILTECINYIESLIKKFKELN